MFYSIFPSIFRLFPIVQVPDASFIGFWNGDGAHLNRFLPFFLIEYGFYPAALP